MSFFSSSFSTTTTATTTTTTTTAAAAAAAAKEEEDNEEKVQKVVLLETQFDMDTNTNKNHFSDQQQEQQEQQLLHAQWIQNVQDLLDMKLGKLDQNDWIQASQLLQDLDHQIVVLQNQPQQPKIKKEEEQVTHRRRCSRTITLAFELLNRLCREKERFYEKIQNNNISDKEYVTTLQQLQPPAHWTVLLSIVQHWSNYRITHNNNNNNNNNHSNLDDSTFEDDPKNYSNVYSNNNKNPNNENDDDDLFLVWNTASVFHCIQQCLDLGVVVVVVDPRTTEVHDDSSNDASSSSPSAATSKSLRDLFHGLIQALQRVEQHSSQTPLLADAIFDYWLKLLSSSSSSSRTDTNWDKHEHSPTAETITWMIHIWANSGQYPQALQKVDGYLEFLLQYHDNDNDNNEDPQQQRQQRQSLRPTPAAFVETITAHSRSREKQVAFFHIRDLFQQMKQVCGGYGIHDIDDEDGNITNTNHLITVTEYNYVCKALSLTQHPKAPDTIRAIFDEMCQAYFQQRQHQQRHGQQHQRRQQQPHRLKPNKQTFEIVWEAFNHTNRPQEMVDLLEHLRHLAEQHDDPSFFSEQDVCFKSLIWAFARLGNPYVAESVFFYLVEAGQKTPLLKEQIREDVWTGVLAAWAQSQDPEASRRMVHFVQALEQLQAQNKLAPAIGGGGGGAVVTVESYNRILGYLATQQQHEQNSRDLAVQAERLFWWLNEQQQRNGRPELTPNGDSYFSVILAWHHASYPERAQHFLFNICAKIRRGKLDRTALELRHFNVVVDAWAKSKNRHPKAADAAQKASAVVDLMMKMDFRPDTVSYNSLLWAWAKSFSSSSSLSLSSTTTTTTNDPADAVERIFGQMLKQWNEGQGDGSVKPDRTTFNAVLYGLTHSSNPSGLQRAEKLFQTMESKGVRPEAKTFNTMMSAYMCRQLPNQAEALFQQLKQQFIKSGGDDDALRPGSDSHIIRLQAWSKVGNPEMARTALQEWICDCEKGGVQQKPATKEFSMVLQAWLRSNQPGAARKAERALRHMMELAASQQFDCLPDVVSFGTVITAYARSKSFHAGKKALNLLRELEQLARDPRNRTKQQNLQANCLLYIDTAVALLQSVKKNSRNGPAGSDSDSGNPMLTENEVQATQVLRDMQGKPREFYQCLRSPKMALEKIQIAIHSSSCVGKEQLLEELRQVAESILRHDDDL